MALSTEPTPPPAQSPRRQWTLSSAGRFFASYLWFILKNIIGWALILVSPVMGFTLPGPGGIPIFLIGFALVSFPGKRKLTARVLRGRPMNLELRRFDVIEIVAAIAIPAILTWPFVYWLVRNVNTPSLQSAWWFATALVAVAITWVLVRWGLRGLNVVIRFMPRIRRKVRPWLRKRGIHLLPPRYLRRRRIEGQQRTKPLLEEIDDQILRIHERHRHTLVQFWKTSSPWLRRGLSVAVMAWIFVLMLRPLRERWPFVRDQIATFAWWRFALAAGMFSVFLLLFRAVSWRRVLKGFGHTLPVWPAVRIWSTSEMARYLPGAIWQVLGRAYLVRPYGVSAVISSTSQILELCIFLFANILVAGACLLWFGAKISDDPDAQRILLVAMCLLPALAALLHPKIFYGIANYLVSWLGKPPIVKRLRGWKLIKLLAYVIVGLLWQSLAVYLIAEPVLHLKKDWWWIVAGSYCLAWVAGFLLAFMAPAGMGIREWVFASTVMIVLPDEVRQQYFPDPAAFKATVFFLGFLLRLWTIAGELMLWGASLLLDYRGALNDPGALKRVPRAAE